ncbi:DUF2142 domain-containing protein [Marisediminicola sp. LYQ85]|uniref:DUF2142 domain-containing protein n=1 Tax=Marisediminicola sp. LYQ85 TaxID=3391062 RepID=UPI0039833FB1
MAADARPVRPRSSRRERHALVAITAAFFAILTLWAFLTPAFRAPDEGAHYSSAVRMATDPEWPAPGDGEYLASVHLMDKFGPGTRADERETFDELTAEAPGDSDRIDQMSQHPPTYYVIAGAVLAATDFEDERWDIGLLTLRMLNVLFLVPLPLLIWSAVRRVTGSPRAALVGAVSILLIPQVAQIGSSVTNDSMVILGAAALTWLASKVMTGDSRWRTLVAMGVVLGLLIFTKGTGLPAVPFVAVVMLFGRGRAIPWGRRILAALVPLGIAGALGGWWWIRNILLYGEVQPSGLAEARPRVPWAEGSGPDIHFYLTQFWNGLSASFWGYFGRLEIPMSSIVTDLLTVVSLLVIAIYAFRRGPLRRDAWVLASFPIATLLFLGYTTWSVYERTQVTYAIQGRYLFSAVVALILLAAIGALRGIRDERARVRFGFAATCAAIAVSAYGVILAFDGFYNRDNNISPVSSLGNWAATSTFGIVGLAIVGTLVAATCTLTVVAMWRALKAQTPATAAAIPATTDGGSTPERAPAPR